MSNTSNIFLNELYKDLKEFLEEDACQGIIERCDLVIQINRVLESLYPEDLDAQKRFLEIENPALG